MIKLISLTSILFAMVCGLARAADPPRPAVKNFLGICGHTVNFKPDLYAPVCSLVRDYHPVEWDLAKDTATLPNWPEAKNRVNWNDIYGNWQKGGFRTEACLMFETEKFVAWKDLDIDAAAYGQSFAARFGPSNAKTPWLEAVEIGNEPGSYTDAQYTQIFKALATGLRAGDPKLKIASCNITIGKSGSYDKSVSTLPLDLCDVLTIHTYALLEPYPTWKRSFPEDPKLPHYLSDVAALGTWRDQHAPGKPIWVTEFGYDATTKKPDPKTEWAKWQGVSEEQQAQYLVRSALVFMNTPADRAYIYFFDDNDEPHMHGSSGITRKFAPKPSYYALAHFQKTLGDFRLTRAAEKPGELYTYQFTHITDKSRTVLVAWSPTGSGRTATAAIDTARLAIDHAEKMPLAAGDAERIDIKSAGAVPITETPLYLFLKPSPR